ncbi:MAG: sugar ABC transporter ATP-binding protein [Verrucomicrobia bacterium]|nr:sugar ABC transporter ATP-binding protein [Verrucomicrobiota bacterium]
MTESDTASRSVALEGRELSKRYGATQALQDVSIRLERGQVTALAGGNGAGKSTLIRLLTGVERADHGVFLRNGVLVRLQTRHDATAAGIFCVYQDQPSVGGFEVYRQIYLGYENHFRRHGLISNTLMRQACGELLGELGLSSISPNQRMGTLSPGIREVVALVGVIGVSQLLKVEHPVILLDEPTSALSVEELRFLTAFIELLKSRSALLFVSHRVTEVLQWADAVCVLRDGRNADFMSRQTASTDRDRVYRAMGGAYRQSLADSKAAGSEKLTTSVATADSPSSIRFSLPGVRLHAHAPAFDFQVRTGEIVGLAGVEGSGKEEVLRFCAGLAVVGARECATVDIDGQPCRRRLADLLRAGIVYLSGERQREGVFGRLSIAENMAVSRRIAERNEGLYIRRDDERRRAERLVSTLSIKVSDVSAPLQSLSGGNQQKVLLGRCLELKPRLMLLDNVTRGVDIGTKASIYRLLHSLAETGVSLVLAGDDLDELVSVTDRIVVFRGGTLVREFDNVRRTIDPLQVLASMV